MGKIFASIIASVVSSAIIGGFTYLWGKGQAKEEYERQFKSAPAIYTQRLGQLINDTPTTPEEKLIQAKSIVSVRNDLRSTLVGLAKLLNSEIDKLEQETSGVSGVINLGDGGGTMMIVVTPGTDTTPQRDFATVNQTLEVLRRKWPSKQDQVDIEVRKLLTELGLLQTSAAQ